MKKVLLKTLNKYKFTIFLAVLFISLNVYFSTYPPKIIGEIVEMGSHLDLIRTGGYYSKLYNSYYASLQ